MEVSFPTQIKNSPGALVEAAKRILEGDGITGPHPIQPGAAHLRSTGFIPFGVIKGARIVESAGSTQA